MLSSRVSVPPQRLPFRFAVPALGLLVLAGSVVAATVRPAVAAARPPEASNREALPPDQKFQTLRLERSRQNHLLLRAFINGKPALLGVDTGAPVSAIAIDRVEHFGGKPLAAESKLPRRLSINGAYNNVVMVKNLQLGRLSLLDEPMVTIDLGGSSRAATLMNEQAIDGIIGADILFPTDAVLDCNQQTLTVKMDPTVHGHAPGTNYRGFTKVPMSVSSGYNLYVNTRVNGTRAKLLVDTGAFSTLLHQPFVRRLNIPLRDTDFTSALVNLKSHGLQRATIARLSIGSVQLRGKEVGVINLEGLIRNGLLDAKPPVAGLLGSEILQRHNGIIDFGTRTLYLK